MHTLIVGNSETDRASFIDRLIAGLEPHPRLYGYRSVKEAATASGDAPIYIYPAEGERRQSEENLLGWCRARQATVHPQAFENYAHLIENVGEDGILVMDEIGPMESKSPRFCAAVLAALDAEVPILASVRDNDTPFLNSVRSHPGARCFFLTRENGAQLFPEALDAVNRSWRSYYMRSEDRT